MVFQRPDSQVLGVRVADDLRWGLPPGHPVPVDELLSRVGLDDAGERETATLSGGELQRLAVAALLARRPAVVVSDESTGDARPRRPRRRHRPAAQPHPRRAGGRPAHHPPRPGCRRRHAGPARPRRTPPVRPGVVGPAAAGRGRVTAPARGRRGPRRGHAVAPPGPRRYRPRHPRRADGARLPGPTGAGKIELLALDPRGARHPGAGHRDPRRAAPVAQTAATAPCRPAQHARPALLRPTVGEEVEDSAGVGPRTADTTLAALGLDTVPPTATATSTSFSGGEQRRVLLAGLLGAGPRVLVLDEPLAGLDAGAASAVREALRAARAAGCRARRRHP